MHAFFVVPLQRRCYWLLNHGPVDEEAVPDKTPRPSDLALAHYLPLPAQPPPSPGAVPPGTPAAVAGASGSAPATTRKKAQPAPADASGLDALVDALQEKSLDELARGGTRRVPEAAKTEVPREGFESAASTVAVADEEATNAATAALAGLKLDSVKEADAAEGEAANAAKGDVKGTAKKVLLPLLPPSAGGGVRTRGRVEREAEAEAAAVLARMNSIKEEHDRAAAEADGALSDMTSMMAALDTTAAEGPDLEQAAGEGASTGGEDDQGDDTAASSVAK